jgi:hypothetical protein
MILHPANVPVLVKSPSRILPVLEGKVDSLYQADQAFQTTPSFPMLFPLWIILLPLPCSCLHGVELNARQRVARVSPATYAHINLLQVVSNHQPASFPTWSHHSDNGTSTSYPTHISRLVSFPVVAKLNTAMPPPLGKFDDGYRRCSELSMARLPFPPILRLHPSFRHLHLSSHMNAPRQAR